MSNNILSSLFNQLSWKLTIIKEKIQGIDLTKTVSQEELNLNPAIHEKYANSGNKHLCFVLKNLQITKEDQIVDYGSGKGGALLTMAKFPFKKIEGIEISEELHKIACKNIKRLNKNNVFSSNSDALNFNQLDDFNYFYFYNPFNEVLFLPVLKKINNTLFSKPRATTLIYNNPVCHNMIVKETPFKLIAKYPSFYNFKIFVYKNNN
ncbi:MAG: class I SAM-dependent methyltransferase [Oligoflexia bacterium]|nr:class I SAM-dependent methyltransferase [Oligoflexia bacterium]